MAGQKRCYYEVLSVSRDADDDAIKRSYRELAKKYHPDRNLDNPDAQEKFKEATEAYEVLRDPDKRARYDRHGHAGLEGNFGGWNGDIPDIISDLFEGFFGGRGGGRRGPRRGQDLQITVEIDLLEAYRGTSRELKIPHAEACKTCSGSGAKPGSKPAACRRCNGQGVVIGGSGFFRIQQTCPSCRGQGAVISDPCTACRGRGQVEVERAVQVPIPPGVDNDTTIKVTGEGAGGDPGAPSGDLYCVLRVRKHSIFVRHNSDLHCEVPITFTQAALGGAIEVPTLDGKVITHNLSRGQQHGDEVRLADKGMPHPRGGRTGDLVVHVKVVTPRNLTRKQEELLRELGEHDGTNVAAERRSFFERVRDWLNAPAFSSDEGTGPKR